MTAKTSKAPLFQTPSSLRPHVSSCRSSHGHNQFNRRFSRYWTASKDESPKLRHGPGAGEWASHAIGPLLSDVITLIVNTHVPNILQDYNAAPEYEKKVLLMYIRRNGSICWRICIARRWISAKLRCPIRISINSMDFK